MVRALAAALCLLLAGCPESVSPLSSPADAAPDPQLLGTWRGAGDDEPVFLHIGPNEALLVEQGSERALKTSRYKFFPTRLGTLTLLNVKSLDEPKPGNYILVRYRVEDDRKLTIWTMSQERVKQDIAAGRLKGKVGAGQFPDIDITADSPALAEYVGSADPAVLFDNLIRFERVR